MCLLLKSYFFTVDLLFCNLVLLKYASWPCCHIEKWPHCNTFKVLAFKIIPVSRRYNGVDGTSCLKVPPAKVNVQYMPQINTIQFVAFIFSCNRGYIWVGKVNYSYPSLGCKDIPEPTISLGKIIL